jgi:hypothetical protein
LASPYIEIKAVLVHVVHMLHSGKQQLDKVVNARERYQNKIGHWAPKPDILWDCEAKTDDSYLTHDDLCRPGTEESWHCSEPECFVNNLHSIAKGETGEMDVKTRFEYILEEQRELLMTYIDTRCAGSGSAPLTTAAYCGNVYLFEELLRLGADIDVRRGSETLSQTIVKGFQHKQFDEDVYRALIELLAREKHRQHPHQINRLIIPTIHLDDVMDLEEKEKETSAQHGYWVAFRSGNWIELWNDNAVSLRKKFNKLAVQAMNNGELEFFESKLTIAFFVEGFAKFKLLVKGRSYEYIEYLLQLIMTCISQAHDVPDPAKHDRVQVVYDPILLRQIELLRLMVSAKLVPKDFELEQLKVPMSIAVHTDPDNKVQWIAALLSAGFDPHCIKLVID